MLRMALLVRLHPPQRHLVLPPEQTQEHGQRRYRQRDDGLEDESLLHVLGRVRALRRDERVADEHEDGAEELTPGPGECGGDGRAERVAQLDETLERDGDEGEAGRAEDGEDDVRTGDAAGLRHPDEDEVAEGDERYADLDRKQEGLGSVDDGRGDGSCDEAHHDENGAANARVVVGEAVGFEHLVEKGGDGVEEADVDPEGDQDEPDFEGSQRRQGRAEAHLGRFGRGPDGCWWFRCNEHRRNGGNRGLSSESVLPFSEDGVPSRRGATYDDGHV